MTNRSRKTNSDIDRWKEHTIHRISFGGITMKAHTHEPQEMDLTIEMDDREFFFDLNSKEVENMREALKHWDECLRTAAFARVIMHRETGQIALHYVEAEQIHYSDDELESSEHELWNVKGNPDWIVIGRL